MTARRLWAWLPWVRRRDARRAALAAAEAADRAAQRAARQRVIDGARRNTGPSWEVERTAPLPVVNRPWMTPGQAWRGSGNPQMHRRRGSGAPQGGAD